MSPEPPVNGLSERLLTFSVTQPNAPKHSIRTHRGFRIVR